MKKFQDGWKIEHSPYLYLQFAGFGLGMYLKMFLRRFREVQNLQKLQQTLHFKILVNSQLYHLKSAKFAG